MTDEQIFLVTLELFTKGLIYIGVPILILWIIHLFIRNAVKKGVLDAYEEIRRREKQHNDQILKDMLN